MITNREAVAAINKLLGSDFNSNIWSKHWNYPSQQFFTTNRTKAKSLADKLLKYFGDLVEDSFRGRGQYHISVFIDNWAYEFLIADLIDYSTLIIFSIYKTDTTLEERHQER